MLLSHASRLFVRRKSSHFCTFIVVRQSRPVEKSRFPAMFRLMNNITAAGPSTMAVVLKRFASSVPKPIINPPIKYTEVIAQEIMVHVESHICFLFCTNHRSRCPFDLTRVVGYVLLCVFVKICPFILNIFIII